MTYVEAKEVIQLDTRGEE